jgi:hypothetical protein
MRCFLPCSLLVFFFQFASVSQAQIGETEAELVGRFGSVQERKPERALEEGRVFVIGERVVLKLDRWRITAVLVDERCAKITYARNGAWTEQHYADLLSTNASDREWREISGSAPNWRRAWQRSDGLIAQWKYAGGLVIEGKSFVDARERLRAIAVHESLTIVVQ